MPWFVDRHDPSRAVGRSVAYVRSFPAAAGETLRSRDPAGAACANMLESVVLGLDHGLPLPAAWRKSNSSKVAPGKVAMLTPSTPTRAMSNSVSSAHRAEANDSPTARSLPHPIVFISSIRSGMPRACAALTAAATLSASPCDDSGDRRFEIVGYSGWFLWT